MIVGIARRSGTRTSACLAPSAASRVRTRRAATRAPIRRFTRAPFPSQRYTYQRFDESNDFDTRNGILYRWAKSPYFFYHVAFLAAGIGGVYLYNLEEVPITGRRRFNFLSPEKVRELGESTYQQSLQEYRDGFLPPSHPHHIQVSRVLERLIPYSGPLGSNDTWTVHVINSDYRNAFVVPGGHVFVFRGILDVCRGDDGLAAVLGHEIAHNIANHQGEKTSRSALVAVGYLIIYALGLADLGVARALVQYGIDLPNSRVQESEADYIGLMIMSQACYNPRAVPGFWQRMGAVERAFGGGQPAILSTHPASESRMKSILEWLPEAESKRQESGCAMVANYGAGFGQALQRWT